MGEEFSVDFRESLKEIFGISEEGPKGRLWGDARVISRAFQGGEIWGTLGGLWQRFFGTCGRV